MKPIVPLLDFVPNVSPRFTAPRHLQPLADLFTDIAIGDEVLACVSCPPRHAKTETVGHAVAWLLRQRPDMRIAYVTYAQTLSEAKSRRMRQIAERARVKLDPKANALHDWRTGVDEGGVLATSVLGPITGHGFDLVILDDVVKDRLHAESSLIRERTYEYVRDTLISRGEPGCSFVLIMHRWHVDDVAGRLIADGWREVVLPAVDDQGNALWPERYSAERLAEIRQRVGEYTWDSLYQGRPRSRGGAVFTDVTFYDAVPSGCRRVIGVDLAYTAKSKADYSVAVICAVDSDGVFYVTHVERRQVAAPDFALTLQALLQANGNAPASSYVSGTERGTLDFMARHGVHIRPLVARADKFSRAQLSAAAWNSGKIRVPREAHWLNAFVTELAGFTGNDARDDQVDALVSAFDSAAGSAKGAAWISALERLAAKPGAVDTMHAALSRESLTAELESYRRMFGR